MSKISIEDTQDYIQMVFVDGHIRTTVSLNHPDGLDLLAKLHQYYSDGDMRTQTVKAMAAKMLDEIVEGKAKEKLMHILEGQPVPEGADGHLDSGQQGAGSKKGG